MEKEQIVQFSLRRCFKRTDVVIKITTTVTVTRIGKFSKTVGDLKHLAIFHEYRHLDGEVVQRSWSAYIVDLLVLR